MQTSSASSLLTDISGTVIASGFLPDWSPGPDWTAQWITTLVTGPYTVTTQARWVKEVDIYSDRYGPNDSNFSVDRPNSITDNAMPSYFVWTLSGSYDFALSGFELSAFGTINNLFDKTPPLAGTGVGGAPAAFYDTIGRNYRVGLRASF